MESKSIKSASESQLFAKLQDSKKQAVTSTYLDQARIYVKAFTRNSIFLLGDVLLLFFAWNYQLHILFNLGNITLLQTLLLIVVVRCLFPIGSFSATLQSLKQIITQESINKSK